MVLKHTHHYRRGKLGDSIIYKCMASGCTHFVQRDLIEGRNCICSRCGKAFLITKKTLKDCPAKPHCVECYGTSNASKDKALDDFIESIVD